MEIAKTGETFVTEKTMTPTPTKYIAIALTGVLIRLPYLLFSARSAERDPGAE